MAAKAAATVQFELDEIQRNRMERGWIQPSRASATLNQTET